MTRTRSAITKLMYDGLSTSAWSQLRNATVGRELVCIASEIVYKYELMYAYSHLAPDDPANQPTRDDVKNQIVHDMSGSGWDFTTEVGKAILDWMIECVYQQIDTIYKNYRDTNFYTATYAGLLYLSNDSDNEEYRVPVSQFKPGTITVLLPTGDVSYPPYSIAVSCGTATFYNILPYRSGEQATLYQGVPYSFNYGADVSGLPEVSTFEGRLFNNPSTGVRYVGLTANTYPESIAMYSLTGRYYRKTLRVTPARYYNLRTLADGRQAVYLPETFAEGSEDWCIRFLDLTNVSFSITDINLPSDYTLVSSEQPEIANITYARQRFARDLYIYSDNSNYHNDTTVKYFAPSNPNVQSVFIQSTEPNVSVYVKPVKDSKPILFDEFESFLNTYSLVSRTYTTYLAEPRNFSVIITKNNPSKFTAELERRITTYINSYYVYENLYNESIILSDNLKSDIAVEFGLDAADFDVSLKVEMTSYLGTITVRPNAGMLKPTVTFSKNDEIEGFVASDDEVYFKSSVAVTKSGTDLIGAVAAIRFDGSPSATDLDMYDAMMNNSIDYTTLTTPIDWKFLGGSGVCYEYLSNKFFNSSEQYFKLPSKSSLDITAPIATYNIAPCPAKAPSGNPCFGICGGVIISMEVVSSAQVTIKRYDTSATATVYTPARATCFSIYNNQGFISCDDGSLIVLHSLPNISAGYHVYTLRDNQGNSIYSPQGIDWNFKTSRYGAASVDAALFTAYVTSDGHLVILYLDPTAELGCPTILSNSNVGSSYYNNLGLNVMKKQHNAKYRLMIADRWKVVLHGIQTVNLREVAVLPALTGYDGVEVSDSIYSAVSLGPWCFTGSSDSVLGFMHVRYRTVPSGVAESNGTLLSTFVYDISSMSSTMNECVPSVSHSSPYGSTYEFSCSNGTLVDAGSWTINNFYMNAGSGDDLTFECGSVGGANMMYGDTYSSYVNLSDKSVIWR